MTAFIGSKTVTKEGLETLLKHPVIALPSSYYFLRWVDRVSGIQAKLPKDFYSQAGHLFNHQLELRWKQKGSSYEVLLLSKTPPDSELGFSALKGEWECCDRPAYFYDNDETKFPQGFLYQDANHQKLKPKKILVKQRYFQDSQTATIHFVALTVGKHHD